MEIDDDSYPMVVTPAPSSPESIAQNTDLKHLWQGRLSSRCIPSEELDQNYKNTTRWEDVESNSGQKVRICGMIQDIGEIEYLPVDDNDDNDNDNGRPSSFIERQSIILVTDYDKEEWINAKSGNDVEQGQQQHLHRDKRVRRENESSARHPPNKFLVYVYFSPNEQHDIDSAAAVRNSLKLHQLVEWVAVKEEDVPEGEMMVDMTLATVNHSTTTTPSSFGSNNSFSADEHFFPFHHHHCDHNNNNDWKLPRLHALRYCLRTMDQLHLTTLPPPLPMQSSTSLIMSTVEATLFLSETLHLPTPVASALWLTLLSRSEPNSPAGAPLALGSASLHLVTPSDETAARLVQFLTTLLQPVVPLLQTWDLAQQQQQQQGSKTAALHQLAQRNGRIRRHPWQLPSCATILVHNNNNYSGDAQTIPKQTDWRTAALPGLIQQHKMSLSCEGCQHVLLPADWRFLVVSTTATQARLASCCTATVQMSWWTPRFTAPSAEAHLRFARTLATLRVQTPSVHLPHSILEQAQADFCQMRQRARENQDTPPHHHHPTTATPRLPDENDIHRWLTYCRLWARSRGSAEASLVDWDAAVQIDNSLQQFAA